MGKITVALLALALTAAVQYASAAPSAAGFVTTAGTKFALDGKPYTVVGSNSYWVGLNGFSAEVMDQAFSDIADSGATTVRTWGFNEVTSPNGVPYYQSWSGSTPTVNTGADGLENFDNVVSAAAANGLKLIVALTNNWADYGGMDVYTKQILGSSNDHDAFYTNDEIKASTSHCLGFTASSDALAQTAFKDYIKTFVSRYADEPTILAWELANEPRCKGSPGTSSGSCTTATVTKWIEEISAYIKSIDSNHLVGVGDEGFFNQPGNPSYPYQGGEGIDFDANLAIDSVDFGTFHAYPESWGQSNNPKEWGVQWIADHATSQENVGKPVIIEEFGVTSNQEQTYTAWLKEVVSSGLAGDLIWQAGSHLPNGDSADDGFAIFPDDPVYPLLQSHAKELKSRDGSA
ncbi:glycoside hydrolase family 5 protein [Schizophyllum fasciatum]